MFVDANEGNGFPFIACAPCSTDAVDIVFRDVGKFKIHDVGELIDVEAPGRDVGGYEDSDRPFFEVSQAPCSGRLALIAVYGGGGDAIFVQL